MRTILCGSRSAWSYEMMDRAIEKSGFDITSVVCGMAEGADSVGWAWAFLNGIPIDEHPAQWKRFGRSAGPIRNLQMLHVADAVVAIWDGESPGTKDTIKGASRLGIPCFVWKLCE